MLSASTARLVDGAAALGEPELVQIKGADKPVAAQRLLGMEERHRLIERVESNLVGRRWEMSAVEGLLDRAVEGHGAVVGVVGPPGIGKSRLVREVSAMASHPWCRGVHRLLRIAHQPGPLPCRRAAACARPPASKVLTRRPPAIECATGSADADPEDLLLFDDLLGIADPECCLAPDRSGCSSAAVDRAGECRVVGPRNPGGLCR